MRQFNTRLFLILVGLTLVLSVVVFVVHYLQTGRIAAALLYQAKRAEEQGQLDQTARYLSRYLEFQPSDLPERANLGRVLAAGALETNKKGAPKARQRALFVLEQVVAQDGTREDLRRQLVKLAMLEDRQDLAMTHLKSLPEDAETLDQMGQCHEGEEHFLEAAKAYAKAIQADGHRQDVYIRLARLMKRPNVGDLALAFKSPDEVLDLLVSNNSESYRARIVRWQFQPATIYKDPEQLKKAALDVTEALKLAPDEADVLLAAGELALCEAMAVGEKSRVNDANPTKERDAALDRARDPLNKGIQLHAKDRRMYLTLAKVELTAEKTEEALAVLDRGLNSLPGQFDLLWMQVNLLLDNGEDEAKLARAKSVLADINKSRGTTIGADYLQSRLALLAGNWRDAAQKLEAVRVSLERDQVSAGLLNQVDLYLARCYEQIDELGLRQQSLERVVKRTEKADPTSSTLIAARRDLVTALIAQGRFDDAVLHVDKIVQAPGAPKGSLTELARVLMARNLARGTSNWDEVQKVLDKAPAESLEAHMMQVRLLIIRGDTAEAEKHLANVMKAFPKQVEPWMAKAGLADLQKQPEKALQVLDEAEKTFGDSVELRLARARHWAQQPKEQAEPELKKLAENSQKFTKDEELTRLFRGLVEANYRAGLPAEAQKTWNQLAGLSSHRNDLRVKQVQFDLAIENRDWAAVDAVLGEMTRMEGPGGPMANYGQALKLIRQADSQGKEPPREARELLDRVAAARPKWSVVHMARAEWEVKAKNYEQAILRLREALATGENRNPRVVYQLVGLLRQVGRTEEASREIRNLPPQALDTDMQWMSMDLALRTQNPSEAVKRAMAAVPRDSNNFLDYLRLGIALAANGQKDEAEKNLRLAVKLGEKEPETWVALCQFLMAQKRKTEAQELVNQAEAALPAELKPLALGRCHEMLGDADQARLYFQAALNKNSDHVPTVKAIINFYIRGGRLVEAEPLLRGVLDGKGGTVEDRAWARRGLALVQAARGDLQHFGEALAFVGLRFDAREGKVAEIEAAPGVLTVDERRVQAQVLSTQPQRAFRTKAIECLQDVESRGALTIDDRHLLARLLEADGSAIKAREQWQSLINSQAGNPLYLKGFADHLLRSRQFNDADRIINELEKVEKAKKVEPGTFGTLELTVRLWEGRGEGDKALDLLRKYVTRQGARPEESLALVSCLARQKKIEEAFALCDKCWTNCPPEAVSGASLTLLRAAGQPTPDLVERVRKRIEAASKQHPTSLTFLLHLADLHDLAGDYPQAQAYYRKVIEKDAKHFVALNNLAWLIVQTSGDSGEALQLIGRAIEGLGERPELLDTRAAVFLARKQATQAIADLEKANGDARTDSRSFRLAQAYFQANDKANAAKVLREAQQAGLNSERLHPIEQKALRQLLQELQPQ